VSDPSAPKVVGLRGTPVNSTPGETDPAMVEFIEDLLRRAKEGKIMGLAGAFMMDNKEPALYSSTFLFAEMNCHNALLGLVEIVKHRMAVKILED